MSRAAWARDYRARRKENGGEPLRGAGYTPIVMRRLNADINNFGVPASERCPGTGQPIRAGRCPTCHVQARPVNGLVQHHRMPAWMQRAREAERRERLQEVIREV